MQKSKLPLNIPDLLRLMKVPDVSYKTKSNGNYEDLIWLDSQRKKPTLEELENEFRKRYMKKSKPEPKPKDRVRDRVKRYFKLLAS